MKRKTLTQNKWLRFLLPIPVGITVYVLILLIFDSLQQLADNFFSQEVMITIVLSFILLESQRVFLKLIDKKYPLKLNHSAIESTSEESESEAAQPFAQSLRIIVIPFASLIFSVVIITPLVWAYFSYLLELVGFSTELIVFNAVFGIVAIIFSMIHVSSSFLAVHKQIHYIREKELRKNLEHDLEKFKLQINPELLYDSLENLISIVHTDTKAADQYIDHLSRIYRYTLDARKIELVTLEQEIAQSYSLLYLLNLKHKGAIHFNHQLSEERLLHQVVPGTLPTLINETVKRTIVNELQPIEINLKEENQNLKYCCTNNPKINFEHHQEWQLSLLNKAYQFFSEKKLDVYHNNTTIQVTIPTFEIEEE